jgi:hypothetical protein
MQVARLIVAGDLEKEVAWRMSIARRTVHWHVERLHARFEVHGRAQLISAILAILVRECIEVCGGQLRRDERDSSIVSTGRIVVDTV